MTGSLRLLFQQPLREFLHVGEFVVVGIAALLGHVAAGTFTDVALEYAGKRTTTKVLTTPSAPEQGVLGDRAYAVIDVETGRVASAKSVMTCSSSECANAV